MCSITGAGELAVGEIVACAPIPLCALRLAQSSVPTTCLFSDNGPYLDGMSLSRLKGRAIPKSTSPIFDGSVSDSRIFAGLISRCMKPSLRICSKAESICSMMRVAVFTTAGPFTHNRILGPNNSVAKYSKCGHWTYPYRTGIMGCPCRSWCT